MTPGGQILRVYWSSCVLWGEVLVPICPISPSRGCGMGVCPSGGVSWWSLPRGLLGSLLSPSLCGRARVYRDPRHECALGALPEGVRSQYGPSQDPILGPFWTPIGRVLRWYLGVCASPYGDTGPPVCTHPDGPQEVSWERLSQGCPLGPHVDPSVWLVGWVPIS